MKRDPEEEIVILKGSKRSNSSTEWVDYMDIDETRALRNDLRELNDYLDNAEMELVDLNRPDRAFRYIDGGRIDTGKRRMRRCINRG